MAWHLGEGKSSITIFALSFAAGEGTLEGTQGSHSRIGRPPIRWGVYQGRGAADNQITAGTLPNENDPFNQHLFSRRLSAPPPSKFLRVSEPENPGVADLTNPTALMATLTNIYEGLIVSRITDDATQLATGYQVSSIHISADTFLFACIIVILSVDHTSCMDLHTKYTGPRHSNFQINGCCRNARARSF